MAGETIREFLVSIGFSVDDSSFNKFNSGVLKATAPVLKLGAIAATTATAVEIMVERVAREMETLYYSSQRTYASADSLMAVGYAARQVGLEAGQGRDLLEGLGRAMRFNPGVEGVLNSLGVQTRDTDGRLRDMSGALDDVLGVLAKMPRFQAMQYANILGLDPETLNQVLNNLGQYKKSLVDARKSLQDFGLDAAKVSEDSVEFARHVNSLEQSFGNLATRIAHDWMPIAEKVIDIVNGSVTAFGKWNNSMDGTPGMIAGITSALGGITAALGVLSKVPGFGWLAGLVGGAAPLAGGVAAAGVVGALTYASTKQIQKSSGGEIFSVDNTGTPVYQERPSVTDAQSMVKFFQARGWSKEQAAGIVANLQQESGFNPDATGDNGAAYGVAQWHADRQKAFEKWSGHSIKGSSLAEQLQFVQYELVSGNERDAGRRLRQAQNAQDAAATFSRYYERPAAADAEAARRGQIAVQITQKTDINVNGAKDASQTAQKVAGEQDRVNGDMVRNLGSVVR